MVLTEITKALAVEEAQVCSHHGNPELRPEVALKVYGYQQMKLAGIPTSIFTGSQNK